MQRPLFWQPLQHSQQQQSHFNGKTFDGRRAAQRKLRNNLISRCYCMNCQILELCKATAALQVILDKPEKNLAGANFLLG